MAASKIPNTIESWEEGLLGRNEKYVAVADASHEAALDEALGLQAICVYLHRRCCQTSGPITCSREYFDISKENHEQQ